MTDPVVRNMVGTETSATVGNPSPSEIEGFQEESRIATRSFKKCIWKKDLDPNAFQAFPPKGFIEISLDRSCFAIV